MKNLFRIADWQRCPQRRVEERKYRSVGSDAERESLDGHGGKAGRLAQHSGGDAQIPPARFHERFRASRTNDSLCNLEASSLKADCATGSLAAQPVLRLLA